MLLPSVFGTESLNGSVVARLGVLGVVRVNGIHGLEAVFGYDGTDCMQVTVHGH
jgi:hypothetical protein